MKKTYSKLINGLFFLSILSSINAQQVWQKKGENQFTLNVKALNNRLQKLNSGNSKIEIVFPNIQGTLVNYEVYDKAVLPKELAKKYPSVHSYKGISKDDAAQIIRFTCTPSGIKGTLIRGKEIVNLISPRLNANYKLVQEEIDEETKRAFRCSSKVKETTTTPLNSSSHSTLNSKKSAKSLVSDSKLRIIRLALATTSEVSNFFINRENLQSASDNQKKEVVLANITTSVNNINEAFERDLGIRFELIPNNDALIFLDNTQLNDTGEINSLIDEGADAIRSIIPFEDYDLGHVIASRTVGGLAGVGVTCIFRKPEGVSGFNPPEGFFFDFTLFAHELGHQLGASHTQNANCEREFTSVEAGSGTTIMGYSGVASCRPNLVQEQSDPFFHSVSIEQILETIPALDDDIDCGIEVNNVPNSIPVITLTATSYTIPAGVPFFLTASVVDPNNDELSYSWEQIDRDIGPSPPEADAPEGPQFRVFSPVPIPRRDFPDRGVNSMWEVLPTVSRTMNFNLLVRDGRTGGIVISDPVEVVMVKTEEDPPRITFPTARVEVNQNVSQTITWEVGASNAPPFNVENVKVELSYDGGVTYPVVLLEETPNSGSANIRVPLGPESEQARIRISAIDNIFFMITPVDFTITRNVDLTISPNPSRGNVTFTPSIPSLEGEPYNFQIFDINGRLVFEGILEGEERTFDFTSFSTGLYIIRIDFNGEIEDQKMIISNN